jgi:hypothetical protein
MRKTYLIASIFIVAILIGVGIPASKFLKIESFKGSKKVFPVQNINGVSTVILGKKIPLKNLSFNISTLEDLRYNKRSNNATSIDFSALQELKNGKALYSGIEFKGEDKLYKVFSNKNSPDQVAALLSFNSLLIAKKNINIQSINLTDFSAAVSNTFVAFNQIDNCYFTLQKGEFLFDKCSYFESRPPYDFKISNDSIKIYPVYSTIWDSLGVYQKELVVTFGIAGQVRNTEVASGKTAQSIIQALGNFSIPTHNVSKYREPSTGIKARDAGTPTNDKNEAASCGGDGKEMAEPKKSGEVLLGCETSGYSKVENKVPTTAEKAEKNCDDLIMKNFGKNPESLCPGLSACPEGCTSGCTLAYTAVLDGAVSVKRTPSMKCYFCNVDSNQGISYGCTYCEFSSSSSSNPPPSSSSSSTSSTTTTTTTITTTTTTSSSKSSSSSSSESSGSSSNQSSTPPPPSSSSRSPSSPSSKSSASSNPTSAKS